MNGFLGKTTEEVWYFQLFINYHEIKLEEIIIYFLKCLALNSLWNYIKILLLGFLLQKLWTIKIHFV